VHYPVESFTDSERLRLAAHFTNLDRPVFALVNLPETVKGALFARYSRYPGTLRRLFLEEFASDLPAAGDWAHASASPAAAGPSVAAGPRVGGEGSGTVQEPSTVAGLRAGGEGHRAAQLYERIFLGYGDDSVAQLGGAHIACEWVSNVLTKILQRPRLGAYLEQSTRYISYGTPMPAPPGGYRYYRDPELGPAYAEAMDELFSIYSSALPHVSAWAELEFPCGEAEAPAAHARAVKAKSLDLLRGLLPASSLSHMGIFASGQTYEHLILHLLAHPLPEARSYGRMILDEMQAVMPSFVARVGRPDRGGEWIGYLQSRASAGERWARRLGLGEDSGLGGPPGLDEGSGLSGDARLSDGDMLSARLGCDHGSGPHQGPSVRLLRAEGDEDDLLAALLFESGASAERTIHEALRALGAQERAALLADLVGERSNRRHRPGRGFEALRYRFEIVSDYGAFRDLQRHRMLTVQWQALTPDLGAEVPEQIVIAGCGDEYRRALEISRREYERLAEEGLRAAAPYALCLGYRIRYIMDLNAREAMALIELRSGREGHPSYRAVAHEMHAQIALVHPAVAGAMTHVDRETEPRLERILSELRGHARAPAHS